MILVGPNNSERSNILIFLQMLHKHLNKRHKIINWNDNIDYLTASSVSSGFEEYKGFLGK